VSCIASKIGFNVFNILAKRFQNFIKNTLNYQTTVLFLCKEKKITMIKIKPGESKRISFITLILRHGARNWQIDTRPYMQSDKI